MTTGPCLSPGDAMFGGRPGRPPGVRSLIGRESYATSQQPAAHTWTEVANAVGFSPARRTSFLLSMQLRVSQRSLSAEAFGALCMQREARRPTASAPTGRNARAAASDGVAHPLTVSLAALRTRRCVCRLCSPRLQTSPHAWH